MILFVFEKNHDFQNSLSWAKIVGLFQKIATYKLFSSKQLDDNINKLEHGSFIEQDCFSSQKSVQTEHSDHQLWQWSSDAKIKILVNLQNNIFSKAVISVI